MSGVTQFKAHRGQANSADECGRQGRQEGGVRSVVNQSAHGLFIIICFSRLLQEWGPEPLDILAVLKGSEKCIFLCEISRCLYVGNLLSIQNKTKQNTCVSQIKAICRSDRARSLFCHLWSVGNASFVPVLSGVLLFILIIAHVI